jgi:hypothetical protein
MHRQAIAFLAAIGFTACTQDAGPEQPFPDPPEVEPAPAVEIPAGELAATLGIARYRIDTSLGTVTALALGEAGEPLIALSTARADDVASATAVWVPPGADADQAVRVTFIDAGIELAVGTVSLGSFTATDIPEPLRQVALVARTAVTAALDDGALDDGRVPTGVLEDIGNYLERCGVSMGLCIGNIAALIAGNWWASYICGAAIAASSTGIGAPTMTGCAAAIAALVIAEELSFQALVNSCQVPACAGCMGDWIQQKCQGEPPPPTGPIPTIEEVHDQVCTLDPLAAEVDALCGPAPSP